MEVGEFVEFLAFGAKTFKDCMSKDGSGKAIWTRIGNFDFAMPVSAMLEGPKDFPIEDSKGNVRPAVWYKMVKGTHYNCTFNKRYGDNPPPGKKKGDRMFPYKSKR